MRTPVRLLTLAGFLATGCPVQAAGPARPNIIVILSDDMGYSDLGCYGGEIATPYLDALAAGGVRFTQFYNAARCCPTRASLLTRLYPHQAGVGHMVAAAPGRDARPPVLPVPGLHRGALAAARAGRGDRPGQGPL